MSTRHPPPPYPSDTRAKGWRFELDLERIEKSQTWLRAKRGDVRAAVLYLWSMAWTQRPCGTLPGDDEDIELLLDFPAGFFTQHRTILMRGWHKADDGLFYHSAITERVLEMLASRQAETDRKAAWRAKKEAERAALTPGAAAIVPGAVPRDAGGRDDTGTGTGTGTGLKRLGGLSTSLSSPLRDDDDRPGLELTGEPASVPDCPHLELLALWREVLPTTPQHDPKKWRGVKAAALGVRWRETAVEKRWRTKADGLKYFRKLFLFIGRSAFLMGRVDPQPGRKLFQIDLEWLAKQANWDRVIEGKYNEPSATKERAA